MRPLHIKGSLSFCYTSFMTDEGSAPAPASEPASAPVPMPPAPTPEQTPAPTLEPLSQEPAPVISPDAIQEISQELTEVVQEAIMQAPTAESKPEAMPEPPEAAPAASSSSPTPPSPASQPKVSAKNRMLTVVRARKAERLEKIVQMAHEKKVITNDDVQLLLGISDSTAARYLKELAVHGRLNATGKRGHIRYEAV